MFNTVNSITHEYGKQNYKIQDSSLSIATRLPTAPPDVHICRGQGGLVDRHFIHTEMCSGSQELDCKHFAVFDLSSSGGHKDAGY